MTDVPVKVIARLTVALCLVLAACSSGATTETTVESPGDSTATTTATGPGGTNPTSPGETTSTAPTTTTLPEDNPLVQAELTVEVDGATILFDQRPFTLMDGSGRVQVIGPSGQILAEGPFEGDDSIMIQRANGDFEFVNASGDVVARMTQQQLNDALDAATPG